MKRSNPVDTRAIKRWMQANVGDHIDECGEVDYTGLVEAWDNECGGGDATLDADHPAWEIATQVQP